MKQQVLFSRKKNNENIFMNVVCCSRNWRFKGKCACFADLMEEIDEKAEGYLLTVRSLSPEKRTTLLAAIQKLFGKSREFGDDKVQLAMQTYEMVWHRGCLLFCSENHKYLH